MNASTKQRVFWIVVVLVIAGVIFAFSIPNAGPFEALSDAAALSTEPQTAQAQLFNQTIVWGLILHTIVPVLCYALLSFSLYFVFEGLRGRISLAVGTAFVCVIGAEGFQMLSGQSIRWQNLLMGLGGTLTGAGFAPLILRLLKRLKPCFCQTSVRPRLEMALEWLSLASVLHYAVFRFVQSTMFQLYFSNWYKVLTLLLLAFCGGIRFLYLVLKKYWAADA